VAHGSTSPVSADPRKAGSGGGVYGADFPSPVTIRDNVRLQRMLLDSLGAGAGHSSTSHLNLSRFYY